MRVVWSRIYASIIMIVVVCLLFVMIQLDFPCFEYAQSPVHETLVPVEGEIGREVSSALWAQRQLDLIALAFLLFVTAAGCSTTLRIGREEQG